MTKQDSKDDKKAKMAEKMIKKGKGGAGEGGTSPKKEWKGVKPAAKDNVHEKDQWMT